MKLLPYLLSLLVAVFFTGCTGLSTLPAADVAYLKHRIETSLADDHCIKEIFVLTQKGKRIAIIKLKARKGEDEERCLTAIRALSHDSNVPAVDELSVIAETSYGSRHVAAVVPQAPIVVPDYKSIGVEHSGFTTQPPPAVISEEAFKTTFSCVITRDALVRGENPSVVVRDGIFVSGPYVGKRVDF